MNKQNLTQKDKDLLDLGIRLQNFYDTGYVTKKSALGFTLLKGIANGVGTFIGGTLVIAVLLWLLTLLDSVPFAGRLLCMFQASLQ